MQKAFSPVSRCSYHVMKQQLLFKTVKSNFKSLYFLNFTQYSFHNQTARLTSHRQIISSTHVNNLLKAAAETKNINQGIQIHAQLITQDFLFQPFLFSSLLNLYAKCGHLHQALKLFQIPITGKRKTHDFACRNVVTWTSLIANLSKYGQPFKALAFFNNMRRSGIYPNQFTFSAVLPACADSLVIGHGQQIHCLVCVLGVGFDVFVGSALVDMYAKCGDIISAKRMFDEMPDRNLVSWNSMIVGCLQNSLYQEAVEVFARVFREVSVGPDQVSFSSALSACANLGTGVDFGKEIHAIVVKHGLDCLEYVNNSLMDMYFKCGFFDDGVHLFKASGCKDVVAWNIMVKGCVLNDNFEEACNYFWTMRHQRISPDEASLSTALHAASSLAAFDQGTSIHNQVIRFGLENNSCVGSSLITMYAKCGSLIDAERVFKDHADCNVVCWTAMISAFQQHGHAMQVINMFEEMIQNEVKPDYITFVCVLSACSHTGRIDEGFSYLNSMSKRHNIDPGPEHYACIVDMLGRAGRLLDARKFVENMPIQPDASVWGALLGACRKYGNLDMGSEVAEKLFEIEPGNSGNYALLCDMYERIGKIKQSDEVRRLMGVKKVRKEPGCSWIDVKNVTYVFTVHDRSHVQTIEIYKMLEKMEELVSKKGYVAERPIDNFSGKNKLWYHSERLALAFGLLSLPFGAPIRIKKNLRTCNDCHTVMKYASEIYKTEIIVRDINRFHRFINGSCSCGDYW